MANKRIGLGILVIVLVFGITAVGCDNGGDDSTCTHEFGTWIVHTQPTQTQSGEEYSTCIKCGYVEYRSIPPTGGGNGGNNPTPLNASSARTRVEQAFVQAGHTNFWVRGGTWDSSTNTYFSDNVGNDRNGAFQGTSAQFSYRYDIEVSFSEGNTNATITGLRYRMVVTWGNSSFLTYVGLSQGTSFPLIESWQNSSVSSFASIDRLPVGSNVVIRGTTGVITF